MTTDERTAQRQDLRRRQHEVQRQIQRLIDGYAAEIISLEDLGTRRSKLEERLRSLQQEEQHLVVEAWRDDHLKQVASQIETFRTAIADGLAHASFATKRAIVELIVDRVVVDAPEVEIRYVFPLTGLAQRNGVLRLHHRRPAEAGPILPRLTPCALDRSL